MKKKKFKRNVLRGTVLRHSIKEELEYKQALLKITRRMIKETESAIFNLFKSKIADDFFELQEEIVAMDESLTIKARKLLSKLTDRFDSLFSDKAYELAEKMIARAEKTSKNKTNSSIKTLAGGLTLTGSPIKKSIVEKVKASIEENVSLIKSIPSRYFSEISGTVMRSITTGEGLKELVPAIRKRTGITDRRVKNLALDQTRKAFNILNKEQMLSLGIKKFEWIHSGGGQKPRKEHIELDGKIFSFDNLPVIEKKTNTRGIPGQLINCRCTMRPVIEFDED